MANPRFRPADPDCNDMTPDPIAPPTVPQTAVSPRPRDDSPPAVWRFPAGSPDRSGWASALIGHPQRVLIKQNVKRTVWRIPDPEGAVYLKEFRPYGLLDRVLTALGRNPARREWDLLNRLWEWGLRHRPGRRVCPEPLTLGSGPGVAWLATREVPDSVSLADWLSERFPALSAAERSRALSALGAELSESLAALDGAGVSTLDLHPGNFLVGPGPSLTVLDLHQAGERRRLPGAAGAAPHGTRLAMVWMNHAVRPLLTAAERLRVWRGFAAAAAGAGGADTWPPAGRSEKAVLRELEALTDQFEERFHRRRDRRQDGSGKYFARVAPAAGWTGSVLLTHRPHGDLVGGAAERRFDRAAWRSALADPEALAAGGAVIKDSRSVRVARVSLPGLGLTAVCKSPRRHKWINELFDLFRPSRARRAWRVGHALLQRGLPTPLPLAVLERRSLGRVAGSLLLTEWLPDAADLDAVAAAVLPALPEPERSAVRCRLGRTLARLMRRLHDAGFTHRDFKGANVLVQDADGPAPRLSLIDMDGIALRGAVGDAERLRSLARLAVSSLAWPEVTDADRVRFLQAYLDGWGVSRPDWRGWWRRVRPLVAAKIARRG